MLNFLRRAVKSWVAKVLLALLVLSFAVWGIGDIFSFRGGTAVATAGEEEVTADEYADALVRQQSRLSQQAGRAVTFSDMRSLGIDQRVLAGLVRDAALRAEVKAAGIAAPDRAVADEIRQNPAFLGPAGNFSDQAYRLLLAQQRMTPAEFEALTRELIGQELVVDAVAGSDATAPGLATRIAAWRGETRNVRLLTLTPAMAADPGEPDDATLQAFFDENAEDFREPERRVGRYLFIDAGKLTEAEAAALDDAAIRAVYEAEAGAYVTQPTRTVEQITFPDLGAAEAAAARLAAGEITFEALAGELGQTATLAIGEIRPGELPEGPDAAVFALTEPGVTGAVETPLGATILRVTALTEGGATPFEDVRDEIAARMAEDAALIRTPELANRADEMRAAGETFATIATELGEAASTGEIPGLAGDGTVTGGAEADGILANGEVANEILAALDGEERDMIELPDGSYFLAYVERIEPSFIPELGDIRDRVADAWRQEAVLRSLDERAASIAAGIARGTGATLDSTAAGMGRAAEETGFFTRHTAPSTVPERMIDAIFAADQGTVLAGRLPDGAGVVLAEVTAIQSMPPQALSLTSEQIEQALSESLRTDRQEYFVRAVEAAQGAGYNPQIIEEVFTRLTGGRG